MDDDSDDYIVIGGKPNPSVSFPRKRERTPESDNQKPQKIFPIGTRFMNLEHNKHDIMDKDGKILDNVQSMYDSFYLGVLRERFNVTTRTDGNVYAYIELRDDEKNRGSFYNDDIVFLVPQTRMLFRTIHPPPTSETRQIQDCVVSPLYQFVRMVAGATTESIKYLIVTEKNKNTENPSLQQQRSDPLEQMGAQEEMGINDDTQQQGFFDANDLDDDQLPDRQPKKTFGKHSQDDQRNVVRDALEYAQLIHSEDDAGNQRLYRALDDPPTFTSELEVQWDHDRHESYLDIPEMLQYAYKATSFDNPNLFASNFVYTMHVASSLVKSNAPGYPDEMWVIDSDSQREESHRFNLGDLLDKSNSFDETLTWFKNIIRSFLLRYVLEFQKNNPTSGMTPVRFWMYHCSETDVGMIALGLLGLVQVPELRNVDKKRVGALTNILCAILTNGTKALVKEFERMTPPIPLLIQDHRYVAKFAHLTALLMARSEGNFTKNGAGYVPNGELPRLGREISYILRWFSTNQIYVSYTKSIPSWLKSI